MPNLNRADARALIPQTNLPDEQIDMVILLVRGWLLDATELTVLPDPLPEWLWAAAVELAALLATNPESLAQKTVGPTSRSWPMSSRRDQIIDRVRRKYRSLRLAPQGSYPDAPVFPEPVRYPGFVTEETGGWFWVGPR